MFNVNDKVRLLQFPDKPEGIIERINGMYHYVKLSHINDDGSKGSHTCELYPTEILLIEKGIPPVLKLFLVHLTSGFAGVEEHVVVPAYSEQEAEKIADEHWLECLQPSADSEGEISQEDADSNGYTQI